MPCYLFTLHVYRTWLPDRDDGFVQRHKGIQQAKPGLANYYRDIAAEDTVCFCDQAQIVLIQSLLQSSQKQQFRCHYISTEGTHVHYLVSCRTSKDWQTVRQSTKDRLTRALNERIGRRIWFSRSGSRRRVRSRQHFDHLVNEYLPRHRGWKWREGGGTFR
jgi:REP element-mobilizing transposase RayT